MKKMQKKEKNGRTEAVKELDVKELECVSVKVTGCFGSNGVCMVCADC